MATTESESEYILNFFNIPQPNVKYITDPTSPSPSAQSENSVECAQQIIEDVESCSEEDSEQELTNLTWLTQLKNLAAWPDSINPILDDDMEENKNRNSSNILKKDTAADRFNRFIDQVRHNRENYDSSAQMFQTDGEEKPPFNYAQIIAMAMLENGRMTLQQICTWIESKFAYYRVRKNWNNSIRHNLSLQFCFRKIDRNKYEKGKGGYWELGMDVTKSERKRIRNRKSRTVPISDEQQQQQKQQQQPQLHQQAQQKQDQQPKLQKLRKIIPAGGISDKIDSNNIGHCNDYIQEAIQDIFGQDNLRTSFSLQSHIDSNGIIYDHSHSTTASEIDKNTENTFDDGGGGGGIDDKRKLSGRDVCDSNNDGDCYGREESLSNAKQQIGNFEVNEMSSNPYLNSSALEGVSPTANDMFEEEYTTGTMVNPTTMEAQDSQIYLASEVPQPSENVIISVLNNFPQSGPNVIVEQLPYAMPLDDTNIKSYFDGIDEEFQFLKNTENRDDLLIDALYDISTQDF